MAKGATLFRGRFMRFCGWTGMAIYSESKTTAPKPMMMVRNTFRSIFGPTKVAVSRLSSNHMRDHTDSPSSLYVPLWNDTDTQLPWPSCVDSPALYGCHQASGPVRHDKQVPFSRGYEHMGLCPRRHARFLPHRSHTAFRKRHWAACHAFDCSI